MTRDYARKKRPAPKHQGPKTSVPWWVWLFIGSVLGAFVMFLTHLWGIEPVPQQKAEQQTAPPSQTQTAEPEPAEESQDLPKPRFDFYKLLKESEVIVPATEPAEKAEQTETAETPVEYLLQVGSFRNRDDADSRRAKLILLNLQAKIESVTIRNGERWHRVVVGPFDSHAKLSRARATLVENQYNALVLKRAPE